MVPTFSFLTSAYRTEHCVAQTIESVLAQTRSDWELIVVDNGASDDMARIVNRYTADARVVLIRQENRGVRGGVTAAAAVATGRYLCPLDSDDRLQPYFCERVGRLIDADPGIDAVGGDGELFRDPDDGTPPERYFDSVGRRSRPDPSQPVSLENMLEHGVPLYIGAYRRELWFALRAYDPAESELEPDVALWLALVAEGRDVRVLTDSLACIRIRPESVSHHPSAVEAFELRLERSFASACGDAEHGASPSAIPAVRRLRYSRALRRARSALLDGDIDTAREAAVAAHRLRRGPRTALILLALNVSPHVLRRAHPLKNRGQQLLHRACARVAPRRRG